MDLPDNGALDLMAALNPPFSEVRPYNSRPAQANDSADWYPSSDRALLNELVILSGGGYVLLEQTPSVGELGSSNSIIGIEDMVKRIQATLGLNVHQIAKLIGVSRATLYNHIQNAKSGEAERYRPLYAVSQAVEEKVPGGIKRGLKNILVENKTLLKHLQDDISDPDRIVRLAVEVDRKLRDQRSANELTSTQRRARIHGYTREG